MALAPKFAGAKWTLSKSPQAVHTVELYLDYVCPFSAKMYNTLHKNVLPKVSGKPYADNVQFVFRQQVQPWHPSSTLVHEAGVAVLRLAPAKFWDFSARLFEQQKEYFDVNVKDETRNATYKRLAKLAASSTGVDEAKYYDLLEIGNGDGDSLNIGNKVTDDFKQQIKLARLVGIHVSPTVVFNGIVENSISSSFSAEEWDEWLSKNCSSTAP